MELGKTYVTIFWSFVFIAVYAEFGQKLTEEFERFHFELNRSNWYQFPIDIQRMLLIVLPNSQQPMTIHGIISCTRETFKEVGFFGFEKKNILEEIDIRCDCS